MTEETVTWQMIFEVAQTLHNDEQSNYMMILKPRAYRIIKIALYRRSRIIKLLRKYAKGTAL